MTKRPGPSEKPSDIQSVQTDIDAQDAIEATQGAARWERRQVQRNWRQA
jgi:hypothetical protein